MQTKEPLQGRRIARIRDKDALFPLFAGLVLLVLPLPLALQRSAWSDDYPMLFTSASTKHLSDMRPLGGLVNTVMFGLVDDIDDLRFLRLVGVIGFAVFAGLLAQLAQSWGMRPIYSALMAVSVGLLPPFHEAVGWATVYKLAWMPILGGLAGLVFLRGWFENRYRLIALGFLGTVITFLFYPPAALWSWGLLGIRTAIRPTSVRRMLKESGLLAALLASSALAALTIALFVNQILDVQTDSRVLLVSTLSGAITKISWFARFPIGIAARPFLVSSPTDLQAILTAGPVLAVIATGLYLRQKGSTLSRVGATILLLVYPCLAMGMHLIVIESQIEYRYMLGITVTMWVYLLIAAHQLLKAVLDKLSFRLQSTKETTVPVWLITMVMGVVILGAVRNSRTNIDQVFIEPFKSKETYLNQELDRFDPEMHPRIVVLNDQSLWPSTRNLGIYSTVSDLAHPWVAAPNIRLLLIERGFETTDLQVDAITSEDESEPNDLVVDLRPYAERLRSLVHPNKLRRSCWPEC